MSCNNFVIVGMRVKMWEKKVKKRIKNRKKIKAGSYDMGTWAVASDVHKNKVLQIFLKKLLQLLIKL